MQDSRFDSIENFTTWQCLHQGIMTTHAQENMLQIGKCDS